MKGKHMDKGSGRFGNDATTHQSVSDFCMLRMLST